VLFNSWQFLVFFPFVTILYFALPLRPRQWMLLTASAVFYMALIPQYILILVFTILVDYGAGLWIARSEGTRRKHFLWASLAANLGMLAIFKYLGFLVVNANAVLGWLGLSSTLPVLSLVLPVGLSFHTFQAMSYTIEVYRGRQVPERDLLVYALYVMFYPQLVAGPIERPQNLLPQLKAEHRFDYDRVVHGLRRMLYGFFKKVFVADRLAALVNQVYAQPGSYHALVLWLATYGFAVQIYCDFSGYSDIAIGSAEVMGIRLMRNFNQPYLATSIREFWNRWHISLSTWFRDYLYIPLGGSRGSETQTVRNLIVVFLVSGFWHGASWTFVVWGALHAVYMIGERRLSASWEHALKISGLNGFPRLVAGFENIVVFHLVTLAWVFFRAPTLTDSATVFRGMFTFAPTASGELHRLGLGPFEILLAAFGVVVLWIAEGVNRGGRVEQAFSSYPVGARWACYYVVAGLILTLGKFSQQQFLYFQF
jgi:alginate O-acetyltransferase complex protein AlgI